MKNIYRFVVVSLFVMSSLQIKLKDDMIDEDNSEEASSKIVLPFLAQQKKPEDILTIAEKKEVLKEEKISSTQELLRKNISALEQQDKTLLTELDKTMASAIKNVGQGELGQALAKNKQQAVKQSINQIENNYKKLSQSFMQDLEQETLKKMPNEKTNHDIELSQMTEDLRQLEKKLPTIKQLFTQIDMDDDYDETSAKIKDLNQILINSKNKQGELQKKLKTVSKDGQSKGAITEDQWQNSMAWILKAE